MMLTQIYRVRRFVYYGGGIGDPPIEAQMQEEANAQWAEGYRLESFKYVVAPDGDGPSQIIIAVFVAS